MYLIACTLTSILTEYGIKVSFARTKERKMDRKIIDSVRSLHTLVLSTISEEEKAVYINNFKLSLGLSKENKLGDFYSRFLEDTKEKGVVYTPVDISQYMAENTIKAEDIVHNPFLRILDPACGCGSILIQCYIYLVKLYKDNLELINLKNNLEISHQEITKHILDNNLFGFDIDETALLILQIDLFSISKYINRNNFEQRDFLTNAISAKYNIILGNPPYVGHKNLNKSYADLLRKEFGHVFRDKGDLSYCFFSKGIEAVTDSGKVTFITSRYFFESPSGRQLRSLLAGENLIERIIDFYGIRPFKGVGIDPAILFITKEHKDRVEILKPKFQNKSLYNSSVKNTNEFGTIDFKRFYISKNDFDDENWIFLEDNARQIVSKIEGKCKHRLQDICSSYQGIITGCDNAFIVTKDIIKEKGLETDIIKPWIKSSHINNYCKDRKEEFLIYSNLIEDEVSYPNIIGHIGQYRERLMRRRECIKGARRWFDLQWGRKAELFEKEKIIFPYKSSNNRFAIDKGSYFSADIYALAINESQNINYEYLSFILNSSLYEFYFKTFGKKLGGDLYEYYPNNLMKLKVPAIPIGSSWSEEKVFEYFELTDSEIDIVMQIGNQ
jgi:adenine-specific DNA-methyltransferase